MAADVRLQISFLVYRAHAYRSIENPKRDANFPIFSVNAFPTQTSSEPCASAWPKQQPCVAGAKPPPQAS